MPDNSDQFSTADIETTVQIPVFANIIENWDLTLDCSVMLALGVLGKLFFCEKSNWFLCKLVAINRSNNSIILVISKHRQPNSMIENLTNRFLNRNDVRHPLKL